MGYWPAMSCIPGYSAIACNVLRKIYGGQIYFYHSKQRENIGQSQSHNLEERVAEKQRFSVALLFFACIVLYIMIIHRYEISRLCKTIQAKGDSGKKSK